ncbi:MAG: response regulator [Armatimonadota bacterium]|nr:MAG: response regulator [Armatimonadota bacterium]
MGHETLRVLIVDDNRDHAQLMEEALREGLDAEPHSCASSREALERIQHERPDVVVLDYRLPDAQGWEALAAIRGQLNAPIIVVTGQGSESAAVEALKAGAEDYVPKEGAYLSNLPAVVLRAAENDRRRREELVHLNKTSRDLAGSLELEAAVGAALDGVMALLHPDAAWLLLPEPGGGLELVGTRGVSPEAAREPNSKFRSCARAAVGAKQKEGTGFLCAGASAANVFGSHDLELLGTIASHTASAVQNARLFASLEQAKAQWERTFDSISDPILISDDRFRVIRLNRAAARCLNLPVRDVPGRVCHRLLLRSEQPCPWHDALSRGVPVSSDRYLSHLGRWFSFSAFPFADADGRPVGVVHVLRDITEERKLRQRINQAQKLAAIGELVAGVAHELNNPLTGILGFSQLLLREAPDTPFRADVEKVANEARRAARIVRNLSAFARRQPLSRTLVDVNELLRKTLELRAYQLRVAGISVELDLTSNLPRILADSDELQQVFLNIVNNAEQAMAGQDAAKGLTIRSVGASPETIRVDFQDTGPGLPEESLDRIFDPFYTTKEPGRGTGLGLSVCYGIVRGHGGQISAANGTDGGAVFTLDLPLHHELLPELSQRPEIPPPAPAQILVVDDEPVVADFVQRVLAQDGHQSELASDGEAALARLREGAFDLVICDLKLPDTSGPRLYEQAVAAVPEMRDRFIFCTGDTLGDDTADFLRGQPGPWLEKPLMPEDVRHAVNHYLSVQVGSDG